MCLVFVMFGDSFAGSVRWYTNYGCVAVGFLENNFELCFIFLIEGCYLLDVSIANCSSSKFSALESGDCWFFSQGTPFLFDIVSFSRLLGKDDVLSIFNYFSIQI